jgi:two-component system, chemotaxis family, protein-glutamate methylesterase/glutaminase
MNATGKIRALVVAEAAVRKLVVDALAADPTFEIVATASDGRQAIERCEQHRPDVVTMDMVLPLMSGLGATEWIMAHCPTPIIILSGSMAGAPFDAGRGEVLRSYDAIAAGAVDVIPRPIQASSDGSWEERLRFVARVASRIKVMTHVRARLIPSVAPPSGAARGTPARVIAVGASTGGPAAVRRLLMGLPKELPAPVLLVMHVEAPFDVTLADWLDGQTAHRVAIATDGTPLFEGPPRVWMSPAGKHMSVARRRICLEAGPERHSCRPSIDVLFESLASEVGEETVGVLLTGMGRDGAAGLLALRQAGAHTIAQDEATSIIYGMPRAAIELGAAVTVLPLDAIAPALRRLTSKETKR